jgi:hypothetical protein
MNLEGQIKDKDNSIHALEIQVRQTKETVGLQKDIDFENINYSLENCREQLKEAL